jgi:hypothetical protein
VTGQGAARRPRARHSMAAEGVARPAIGRGTGKGRRPKGRCDSGQGNRPKGRIMHLGFDLIYAENMGTLDCKFQLLILSVGTLLKIT